MDRVTASSSGGAASTFVVRLYLSTNMTFGDSDDVTAGERVVSNLFPGQYSAGNLLVPAGLVPPRSEEHTSELLSRPHLVCRLLLEKKKKKKKKKTKKKNKNKKNKKKKKKKKK